MKDCREITTSAKDMKEMKFGYRRYSKEQTDEERQLLQKIYQYVTESRFIFADEKNIENTQECYGFMRQLLRAGDELYIDRLDSLGANFITMAQEWQYITQQVGARIVVIEHPDYLDSSNMQKDNPTGISAQEYFLFLLQYLNEIQRKRMRESQRQGIEEAVRSGKKMGRPCLEWDWQLFAETAERWSKKEITAEEACRIMKCTRSSWYKYTKQKGYRP